jgi:hypothetical protein
MNDFRHTGVMYGGGYVANFYTRFSRNPFLNTLEKIDKYVVQLATRGFDNATKEANLYLGLMTIEERREFIEWVIQSYSRLYKGEIFLEMIH